MFVFAQMSTFGGHHAKEASDQQQKKLQEEAAMADEIEKSLVKAAAGMNIRDDDNNYSSDDDKYRDPGYKSPVEEDDTAVKAFELTYAAGVKVRSRAWVGLRERCAIGWVARAMCDRVGCATMCIASDNHSQTGHLQKYVSQGA